MDSRVPVHPGELVVGVLLESAGGCGRGSFFLRHRRAEDGVLMVGRRGLHAQRIQKRWYGIGASTATTVVSNTSLQVSLGR